MLATTVLWVYIVLLLAGGVMGFVKAKSKPSLIASALFGLLLIGCQLHLLGPGWVADLLLILLLVVFGQRLAKTKKFMPAGLMLVVTLVALIFRRF